MFHQSIASRCDASKSGIAKLLRKEMTTQERKIWFHVRGGKMGQRIHRQRVMFGYIVDFYCPKARLCIELDGSVHDRQLDRQRDNVLYSHGFTTVRYTNDMVDNLLQSVLKNIRFNVELHSARYA